MRLLLLALHLLAIHLQEALALDGLQDTADDISSTLHTLFQQETNFTFLQDTYANLIANGSLRRVEGEEVIQNIAETLADDFDRLRISLQQSLDYAESQYSAHVNTGCCSEVCTRGQSFSHGACNNICSSDHIGNYSRTQYYWGGSEDALEFESDFSSAFCRDVTLNESAVHIPVNIYEQDPSVRCFVQWTGNLTTHFRDQWDTLGGRASFQYIGASTGILRFYPASDWSLLNRCDRCLKIYPPVDTYDTRNRPWYVNTVPGTKFIVILLDMSGSMAGFRLLLARSAVVELLKSLTQNDYFQVILVNKENRDLNCFPGKTRASPENILLVNTVISNTNETRTQAKFEPALERAFQVLSNSSECHKTMVIFTDGDEVTASTFDTLNADKAVRVFTYLIGRGRTGAVLESIARNNRGKMSHIQVYSDIVPAMRSFTEELRRQTPPGLSRNSSVFWSHYRDVFGGLVVSGSLPLVRDTNGTQEFLGVMGIDMKPQSIEARIAQHNLGPLGYGFVADNNGQLIVHPLIDRNYTKKLSSDDLISLDMSDFEHTYNESDFESVRQAMIDRNVGHQSLAAWLPVKRKRHYLLQNVTYFHAPIEGTPFSVAIVLPSDGVDAVQYPNVTMAMVEKLNAWEIEGGVYLDDRPYCSGVWGVDPLADAKGFLTVLIQELVGRGATGTPLHNCNPSLYQPLLSDLYYIMLLQEEEDVATSDGLVIQFTSGLTWCSGGLQCSQLHLLQLAGEEGSDLLLYPDSSGAVVATRSLHIADADRSAIIGVVGFVLSNQTVRAILDNVTSHYYKTPRSNGSDIDRSDVDGSDTDGFIFYLLDRSGYIVLSTSSQDEPGEPMDSVQPDVFKQLVEEGVFKSDIIRGYELKPCELEQNLEPGPCKESDALSLHHSVLLSLSAWLKWTLTGGLWTAVRLMTLSFLSSILSYTGWSVSGAGGANGSCPVSLCLQQRTVYQLQEMSSGLNGSVMCTTDGRTLEYHAAPLSQTSMLLVAVNGTCNSTSLEEDNLRQDQSQYPILCPCNCMECGRYRRLPPQSVCYDNATSYVPNSQSSRAVSIDLYSIYVYVTLATLITTVLYDPAS